MNITEHEAGTLTREQYEAKLAQIVASNLTDAQKIELATIALKKVMK